VSGVYGFAILQKEDLYGRSAGKSTECRIRLVIDFYDLIYASIDEEELLKKFEESFKDDIESNVEGKEGIRMKYEYVLDLDHEHANMNPDVDDARNELERRASSIHRRLFLFARVHFIITQEAVKEYFGKYAGSWNPDGMKGGEANANERSYI